MKSYYQNFIKITGQKNQPANSIATYAENITRYLENIIALSPGNLYWKDRNGVYLGCNNNMAKMVGLARQEVIGKNRLRTSLERICRRIKGK